MCTMRVVSASLLLLACALPGHAAAVTTLHGVIQPINADQDAARDDLPIIRIAFRVTAPTVVTFDTLVTERPAADLNNDGRITGFNALARLLRGPAGTQVAANNNRAVGSALNQDGSTSNQDPAFSYTFTVARLGDYVLALGQNTFTVAQARAGFQLNQALVSTAPNVPNRTTAWGAWQLQLRSSNATALSGITVLNPVPEPGLIGLALAGAGAWFLRRRQAQH